MLSIYGKDFYCSRLKHWAGQIIDKIPQDISLILSTGSSGSALASSILTIAPESKDFKHIYVRKPEEDAHDIAHAGRFDDVCGTKAVVVDDIISTGRSINRVLKFAEGHGIKVSKIIVAQDYRRAHDYISKFNIPIDAIEIYGRD